MNKELGKITPTQLIRKAALNTHKVNTPSGKFVIYEEIEYEKVDDMRCYLCGGETDGLGELTKKTIKPTFTDRSYARDPSSRSVCRGCFYCLSRREMRNYSIVATENELKHPSRPEMRELLMKPPDGPFVFCVAESGQKWIHFKSRINYNQDEFYVAMEENMITVKRKDVSYLLDIIEPMLHVFTKTEIETGQYKQKRVLEFGLSAWREQEKKLQPWRGGLFFTLIVQVAQKTEESPKKEEIIQPEPELEGQMSIFDLEGVS